MFPMLNTSSEGGASPHEPPSPQQVPNPAVSQALLQTYAGSVVDANGYNTAAVDGIGGKPYSAPQAFIVNGGAGRYSTQLPQQQLQQQQQSRARPADVSLGQENKAAPAHGSSPTVMVPMNPSGPAAFPGTGTSNKATARAPGVPQPPQRQSSQPQPPPSSSSALPSRPPAAGAVNNPQQFLRNESLLLWKKPLRQVVFREWYIFHYCNEQNVRMLDKVQRLCYPFRALIVFYFKLWSFTGEAEFYTTFLPTLVWLGTPLDAIQVASMLCMGQYVTGTLKDALCCPRPPCPPLELRGSRETHDKEYGFPSTHSSHCTVFAYFLYCELVRFFPDSAFTCWCVAVFYWFNVCFSRLYLGMHWMGDLIGGWLVAFLCILFHVSFVDRWEENLLSMERAPWWVYGLGYAIVHVLAMSHATPHDPCPCYVDSLRFSGAVLGCIYGVLAFRAQYGTMTARPRPASLFDEMFSWTFFKQWCVCIVLTVVSKELTSVIGGKVLKVIFKLLSGAYVGSCPRPLRRPYIQFAKLIGLTTRGNERGGIRYYPITANSSFAVSVGANANVPEMAGAVQQQLQQQYSQTAQASATSTMIEEPDGYLHHQQAWSLRTHEHWWLWDAHKRTLAYATSGFFMTYVGPVVLREYFGVGADAAASASSPLAVPAPP